MAFFLAQKLDQNESVLIWIIILGNSEARGNIWCDQPSDKLAGSVFSELKPQSERKCFLKVLFSQGRNFSFVMFLVYFYLNRS